MQLFAIIAKQDGGVEETERNFVIRFLKTQLNDAAVQEYLALFDKKADYDPNRVKEDDGKIDLTSVKDSVRILGLCKKINKTLTQNQKIVVLVRLFELVNADRKFSDQRMAIINTVAEVFKLSRAEFTGIENFVVKNNPKEIEDENLLVVNDKDEQYEKNKHIQTKALDANVFILHIPAVDLYFLKYTGSEDLYLNGLGLRNRSIYLFAKGSTIKLPKGKPIYYSDVVSKYMSDSGGSLISFDVKDLEFRFPNGNVGLREINISEPQGKLIGIMGASGAGKTTLLNVLSGQTAPSSGDVRINGINLHKEKDRIEGVIGYIPQDDLLIEELTVFENLFYNAKLCFKDMPDEEITERVNKTLMNLGLFERKDLKVGNPLKKTISGGQRKRLNIALELIREPSILFVDEPTSGLSSKDSENVMDLLRELTLKGKLIFVVIHQPSSEIYKMFDKMVILDTGGFQIYYGNPVEAVMYFKRMDSQVNSDVGECPVCGNVNPELIFNIIEAQVVDEFGNYVNMRKVEPPKWEERYKENVKQERIPEIEEEPPKSLDIPGWFKQSKIFGIRDFLSKISNTQYIILNVLEAPVLGLILAYIIRYIADPNSDLYIFRENENIPPYVFMTIIVALFLGLTVSAEEIYKDRKILNREKFLNLSRSAYLTSKITILFVLSALQSFLFVAVGNTILGVNNMFFEYWFSFFTIAAFANMLGLNISATFNSAVTIYIIIPLLLIPQMVLGGAMFSFDKINRTIGAVGEVPLIAEFMASRWAYEALMVDHFKNNEFEKYFFDVEKEISVSDFKQVYYLPRLIDEVDKVIDAHADRTDSTKAQCDSIMESSLALLRTEIPKEEHLLKFNEFNKLHVDSFSPMVGFNTKSYLKKITGYYSKIFNLATKNREKIVNYWMDKDADLFFAKRNNNHNETVEEILKKVYEKNKILRYKDELVQQVDPIFLEPEPDWSLDFRTHFYAPSKHFGGNFFDTFMFNMIIIWIMTAFLYITLYYEHLKKLLELSGKINFSRLTSLFTPLLKILNKKRQK